MAVTSWRSSMKKSEEDFLALVGGVFVVCIVAFGIYFAKANTCPDLPIDKLSRSCFRDAPHGDLRTYLGYGPVVCRKDVDGDYLCKFDNDLGFESGISERRSPVVMSFLADGATSEKDFGRWTADDMFTLFRLAKEDARSGGFSNLYGFLIRDFVDTMQQANANGTLVHQIFDKLKGRDVDDKLLFTIQEMLIVLDMEHIWRDPLLINHDEANVLTVAEATHDTDLTSVVVDFFGDPDAACRVRAFYKEHSGLERDFISLAGTRTKRAAPYSPRAESLNLCHAAIRANRTDIVRFIMAKNTTCCCNPRRGMPGFHYALSHRRMEMAKLFLRECNSVDVDKTTVDGRFFRNFLPGTLSEHQWLDRPMKDVKAATAQEIAVLVDREMDYVMMMHKHKLNPQ